MADIKQAAKWMQDGKPVRRKEWPSGQNIRHSQGGRVLLFHGESQIPCRNLIIFYECKEVGRKWEVDLTKCVGHPVSLLIPSLIGEDWEVAEEHA